MAQTVKNLPAMWETQVPTLNWKDALEKGRATHSSILDWRAPWTEEPGGLCPWARRVSDTAEQLTLDSPYGPASVVLELFCCPRSIVRCANSGGDGCASAQLAAARTEVLF